MALVVPNQGEQIILEAAVGKTAGQNLIQRLFTSNTTPAETDTEATYTEAAGNGYAPITFTPANWTFTAGNPSTLAYAQQTFPFTGALGNVYGHYFTQATSGKLLMAERFTGAPLVISNNGDDIKITTNFTGE